MTQSRQEFFGTLFEHCEAMIETRILPGGVQDFWPADFFHGDMRLFDNYCRTHRQKNIYFGVATRDGDGGSKANIVEIPSLHCDLDFKDTPPAAIKANLSAFPFRPTIAVHTGGGFHCYWVLKEPAAHTDIATVEAANRRIAAALGGDHNACDAARILRVPGTDNIKRSKPVVLRAVNPFRYCLEDFQALPAEGLKRDKIGISDNNPPAGSQRKPDDKAQLVAVFACRFMRWCYSNQASVAEPLWYAMISNLCRVSPGGVSLCHLFSEGHPKYTHQETAGKILKALDASGPHTCQYIQANGFTDCGGCAARTPLSRILKRKKYDFGSKSRS